MESSARMRSAVADRAIAQRLFGKLLFFFFGLGLMEDKLVTRTSNETRPL